MHHMLTSPVASAVLPPHSELVWTLALLWNEITSWTQGQACRLCSAELGADPQLLTVQRYPVLPLPGQQRRLQWPAETDDALVNERAGIILHLAPVEHHPSVPARLYSVQAHLPSMQRHDPTWYNVSTSLGSSFDSVETAQHSAIGEAIERYCMNYLAGVDPNRASYGQLVRRGEHVLDPERLVLFSDTMYETPGFPFVRFTQETEVYWVRGTLLGNDQPAWLPLSLVYTHWRIEPYADQPLVNNTHYPGVAAGRTLEQALVAGIEELIERDSMMVWWMNRQPLPALRLTPELQTLWQGAPTELGQRAWAISIPNEFNIPVIAGVVEQTHEQFLTIGFACRPDAAQATRKAWAEALTLQERSRDLNTPTSALRQELEAEGAASLLKPWRSDRSYMDAYRSDFRDCTHIVHAEQFYLDPRAIEWVRPWVDVPASMPIDAVPTLPDRTLASYQRRLAEQGYEVFYADLSTPDVRGLGWRVVRVLIPGLVPEFPAAFPQTGCGRIEQAGCRLGWRTTPFAEAELNYMPIPYA
jgi:ribosomal protein S12 methylthiotransferase accessory factor